MTQLITGNTYPVRDQIMALGGRWNPTVKGWSVPDAAADKARALVAGAPVEPRRATVSYTPRRAPAAGCRHCCWTPTRTAQIWEDCDHCGHEPVYR